MTIVDPMAPVSTPAVEVDTEAPPRSVDADRFRRSQRFRVPLQPPLVISWLSPSTLEARETHPEGGAT